MSFKNESCLFLVLFLINNTISIEDYCSINNYVTNGTHMQFTKEPSFQEFAIAGKFKGLHCCAKNYRSIEWLKNGKPYPWPLTMSQLFLYPENVNQTVYTKSITLADAGNYTCILRNDTISHSHTIMLEVFDKVPEEPKITFISEDRSVSVGQNLRLFCEAFAGRIDLPDAYNEAIWSKIGSNRTLFNESRIHEEKISRENGQTFGTYLIINEVNRGDFGTYVCKISKPGKMMELYVRIEEKVELIYLDPNPVPIEKMLVVIISIILICVAIVVLNMRYGLEVRMRYQNSFGTLEENDGKSNDALILYSDKDSEIALGILLPRLENIYNYKCGSRKLLTNIDLWAADLKPSAEKSRRIIVVLSSKTLNDTWDTPSLYKGIKQLCALGPKVTVIALQKFPVNQNEVKNSQGETLKSILNLVHVLPWIRPLNDRWWLNLCLKMPPKRRNELLVPLNISQEEVISTRLRTDSQERINILV